MFTSKYTTSFKREVVKFYLDNHSVNETITKFDIAESTLFEWRKEYLKCHFYRSSKNRLNEYKQKTHQKKLEQMLKVLQLSGCNISSSTDEKICIIERLAEKFSIRVLCEALQVPRGTYYNRQRRKCFQTKTELEDEKLKTLIKQIYKASNGRFGKKPIKQKLAECGYNISEKRVSRLMNELNIHVEKPKFIKFHTHHKLKRKKFKNLLERNFQQDRPNAVWVSDITYIRIKEKFIFLCSIIDLFSRKVIAYGLSDKIDTALTLGTFDRAYIERGKPENLMFHSDQGIQYTSLLFREYLKENKVQASYSNPGTPYDNAVCESFFGNLKKECIYHHKYKTLDEVSEMVEEYVFFFNGYRPHRKLKMLTPNQIEEQYLG